ncbi:MAG: ABC transporter permease [Chitinophagaceae bacterium]|jgi:putative ABC transport system permease protein|nr:ABC transporter permease [Chitinophagaceae bacterium]
MNKQPISFKWLALMAWRDSRRNRSRLLLFVSSIILGIAALVAIFSLSNNLKQEIDNQAASLLGADLEISDNKPFSPTIRKLIDSLGDRKSEERRFTSMAYFPKNGGSRLIEARALGGDFPYYGKLETTPAAAGKQFRNGQQALVDQTLMLQYDVQPGDSVRVGNTNFIIAGSLEGAPGQSGLSASVAPVVYIPLSYLEQTGLEQKGSRINYRYYFKYDRQVNMQKLMQQLEPVLDAEDVNYDTTETQKEDTARSFRDVTRYLTLIGFVALLLGCIGVASAIHIYVREKINTIAVLRCLGASASQAFLIYLLQITAIGMIGSILGAALGTIIQQFLPIILKELLPIEMNTPVSWLAIGQGILSGLIISLLFALLPLVSIRKISPLNTLRISFQPSLMKDPLKWLIYSLILIFIFGFTLFHTRSWQNALAFTFGITIAFLILSAIASLLIWAARKFFPDRANYLWRQGFSNLFRPNNQTTVLIVSIGLGTALVCTLFFVQNILLSSVTLATSGNQPNMVLFDIQTAQREKIMTLAKDQDLQVHGMVPIVNMRLERINNITPAVLEKDSTLPMRNWIFSREYRVTFRDTISSSEKITEGKWVGVAEEGSAIPISMEQRYAERNGLEIGDTLIFNVQGALMPTIISSFREVDWNRIQTNFLVVFPKNSLEAAPQFHVLMTRVQGVEKSAAFQRSVVQQFPNVSIIDLGLILSILDNILSKIGFVIRFMAAFSIITGLVVLIASIMISKFQRIQETVLLRTLGASRKQVFAITALEYFFLGAMASLTGILLALAASWALAKYTFETSFTPQWLPVPIIFIFVCALTVSIGLFNSRDVLNKPPLDILRQEV